MQLPIYQVDAFTNKCFGGNPAAVVPLESWIPDSLMQSIAMENQLSETAFFVKEGEDQYLLRWFTPSMEIDLCGHATLASAHVLYEHLEYNGEAIQFNTLKSGVLPVIRNGDGYQMDFPARPGELVDAPKGLFEALGIDEAPVFKSRDYLVVLETQIQVQTVRPDFSKLAEIDTLGIIITAPGDDADFVSRFFAPRAGVNEDPVTGSAHCTLAPYWSEQLNKQAMHAYQLSERVGEVFCIHLNDRVHLGGHAVTYLEGTIVI